MSYIKRGVEESRSPFTTEFWDTVVGQRFQELFELENSI